MFKDIKEYNNNNNFGIYILENMFVFLLLLYYIFVEYIVRGLLF